MIISVMSQNETPTIPPSRKDLKKWAKTFNLKFPVLVDILEGVYTAYVEDDRHVPYNFIIDKEGKIRWRKSGFDEATRSEIENLIMSLLQ